MCFALGAFTVSLVSYLTYLGFTFVEHVLFTELLVVLGSILKFVALSTIFLLAFNNDTIINSHSMPVKKDRLCNMVTVIALTNLIPSLMLQVLPTVTNRSS